MLVRADLRDVEDQIFRLISIGQEFRENDQSWSHLKNREDWIQVYGVGDLEARQAIERVYESGRDMASFMADALASVNNDFKMYPTLTSIVERFQGSWVFEELAFIPDTAEAEATRVGFENWALSRMLLEFRAQLLLLDAVKQSLGLLTRSNTYKRENGMQEDSNSVGVTISHVANSAIAINSPAANVSVRNARTLFRELEEAIQKSGIQGSEPLIVSVQEMAAQSGSTGLLNAYRTFMSLAADHMQVIQPFLQPLAALMASS